MSPGQDERPPIATAAVQIYETPHPTLLVAWGYVPLTPDAGTGPINATVPATLGRGRLYCQFLWDGYPDYAQIDLAWLPDVGPASNWHFQEPTTKIPGAFTWTVHGLEANEQRIVLATITVPDTPGQE